MSKIKNQTSHFKKKKKSAKTYQGITVGLLVAVITSIMYLAGAFKGMEKSTSDWRRRNFTTGSQGTNIIHVMVTQNCLTKVHDEEFITWPWPREAWGLMLNFLKQNGARAAVFDIIFSEHSRNGVADDKKFISAITNFGSVFFSANFTEDSKNPNVIKKRKNMDKKALELYKNQQKERSAKLDKFKLKVNLKGNNEKITTYMALTASPFNEYIPVLTGIGNVFLATDKDGINRRKKIIFKHLHRFFPDLSLAVIMNILKIKEIEIDGRAMTLINKKNKKIKIPLDENGNVVLKFHDSYEKLYKNKAGMSINAADLLDAARDPIFGKKILKKYNFKNKIVIFGTSAPGLLDLRANPFYEKDPGAYLYSTMIDNILNNDFLKENYNPILIIILIFAFSIMTGLAGSKLTVFKGVLVTIALSFIYIIITIIIFSSMNTLIELASIQITILVAFLLGLIVNYFKENRQKSFIQGAFSNVLAPAILDKLMADPTSLGLGGESKELTIFFSDLQGFTTFSEELGSPQKLVNVLNKYLTAMSDIIIMDYDGYVDKYEGDAIMAFWGAPVDDPDHAWKACHAALDNQTKLKELQEEFKSMGLKTGLKVRIGLNTGIAMAGMIGSLKKLNYTIIGDSVNLASRLEGANKQYQTLIMLSETTKKAAGDKIITRPLDLIRVKGKTEPTSVFELVAKSGEANQMTQDLLGSFEQGINAYKNMDFNAALKFFEKSLSIFPDDGPSKVYINRCKEFIKNPPAQPWDGVYTMTTK